MLGRSPSVAAVSAVLLLGVLVVAAVQPSATSAGHNYDGLLRPATSTGGIVGHDVSSRGSPIFAGNQRPFRGYDNRAQLAVFPPEGTQLGSALMAAGSEFLDRFEEFVGASGWRTTPSPAQLVAQWRDFVEACKEGYSSTIYDYENERTVRDLLDKALNDPILRRFSEIEDLRSSVDEIDERFRQACRQDVTVGDSAWPWWRRCVPQRAEGEFAVDLRALWGVEAT